MKLGCGAKTYVERFAQEVVRSGIRSMRVRPRVWKHTYGRARVVLLVMLIWWRPLSKPAASTRAIEVWSFSRLTSLIHRFSGHFRCELRFSRASAFPFTYCVLRFFQFHFSCSIKSFFIFDEIIFHVRDWVCYFFDASF